jgi:hypothetical protein
MARKTGHFVSTQLSFSYGVTVHQVWSVAVGPLAPMDAVNVLKYETTSKSKANAVCEYLNLKAQQDDLDQYRSDDIKGTIVPGSISFPGRS